MPTRITHFLHYNDVTGAQVLTTSFDLNNKHTHDLTAYLPPFQRDASNFFGIVNAIEILLTSATSATKCTIRVCKDAAGDVVIVPDTEADLVAGITTGGTKSAVFKVDIPIRQDLASPGNGILYLFIKVDDATSGAVFTGSQITWQE